MRPGSGRRGNRVRRSHRLLGIAAAGQRRRGSPAAICECLRWALACPKDRFESVIRGETARRVRLWREQAGNSSTRSRGIAAPRLPTASSRPSPRRAQRRSCWRQLASRSSSRRRGRRATRPASRRPAGSPRPVEAGTGRVVLWEHAPDRRLGADGVVGAGEPEEGSAGRVRPDPRPGNEHRPHGVGQKPRRVRDRLQSISR